MINGCSNSKYFLNRNKKGQKRKRNLNKTFILIILEFSLAWIMCFIGFAAHSLNKSKIRKC